LSDDEAKQIIEKIRANIEKAKDRYGRFDPGSRSCPHCQGSGLVLSITPVRFGYESTTSHPCDHCPAGEDQKIALVKDKAEPEIKEEDWPFDPATPAENEGRDYWWEE
jgi:hypothetical protein